MATTTSVRETIAPRLFTRADALAILKIGETTLFWLQRTGKLNPIRIGSRVLFNATDIDRVAARGATLTAAEKEAAAKPNQIAINPIPKAEVALTTAAATEMRKREGAPNVQRKTVARSSGNASKAQAQS